MPEHQCGKEREIGEITTTLKFFQDAEKRREEREVVMLSTMQQIAGQGEVIKAHTDTMGRFEKSFENLFGRVHALEKTSHPASEPGEVHFVPAEDDDQSFVIQIYRSKAGPYVLAVLVAGFLVGVGTNYDAVAKVAKLILG